VDLDAQDIDGLTPLHCGVLSGNSKIVKRLITKGANQELKVISNIEENSKI